MHLDEKTKLMGATALGGLAALSMLIATPAIAQETDDDDEVEEIREIPDVLETEDKIVVTGSRLRRDAFTSAAPLQVIDGQIARESGLFNVQEMLQASPQVTGSQVDQTFIGFVLDNGPGSAEVNFRGLGANRTLVLINGKRLAPAGVEGAPNSPDVSLIPSILIERIENLLDGASSVYGSDAVAGVSNIILKSDFDGLRLEGNFSNPEEGGADQIQLSALWGKSDDDGSITFAFEYNRRNNLVYGDRDYLRCNEYREQGESGQIRSLRIDQEPGVTPSPCKFSFFNRIFLNDNILGSLYRSPDGTSTNFDIPGYFESSLGGNAVFRPDITIAPGGQIDADGDGLIDVDFYDPFYNPQLSPVGQQTDFLPTNELISFYTSGERNFDALGGATAYFEAFYNQRQTFIDRGTQSIGIEYPATSPFNPCQPGNYLDEDGNDTGIRINPKGVDCYIGFGLGPNVVGTPGVIPDIEINNIDFQEIEVAQTRLVAGLRGDLEFLNKGPARDWRYDVFAMFSRSNGQSLRPAINNDRLVLSVNTARRLEDGSVVCGIDVDGDGIPDGSDTDFDGNINNPLPGGDTFSDCVPVNLFAPGKFGPNGGSLTPAEYDYLISNRIFNTIFEQTVISGFMDGVAGVLPWNAEEVNLGVGFEYREDRISSRPDFTASEGQQYLFFTDPGASGSRDLYEGYFEMQTDVLKNVPFAQLLSLEFAARFTEESFYGSAWTYSGKGFWKPSDWLTIRGTYGTSFRAPNAREQFLNETSGFIAATDSCVVPESARLPGANLGDPEVYDPNEESRTPELLAACTAQGVDPTSLGLDPDQDQDYTIEVLSGGAQELDPETSRSWTAGVVLEPLAALESFGGLSFDRAGLQLSATYFDILVEDAITEVDRQNILDECLAPDGGTLCSRIFRDSDGFVGVVDESPLNVGRDTSVGVDFNMLFTYELELAGEFIDISLDGAASWLLEQQFEQLGVVDDNAGETESPDWTARINLLLSWEDFRFNWFTRFIQGGEENATSFDDNPTCTPEPNFPNTALGDPMELCRPVYFTTDYWTHNASIAYSRDTWTVNVGVRNVFNREPELVDSAGVTSIRNVPIGVGYDVLGRTAFINVAKTF